MPIHSRYPPITVPAEDLWAFVFDDAHREYPESHGVYAFLQASNLLTDGTVFYVDTTTKRQYTFSQVRAAAEQFGKGLLDNWGWRKGDVLAFSLPIPPTSLPPRLAPSTQEEWCVR